MFSIRGGHTRLALQMVGKEAKIPINYKRPRQKREENFVQEIKEVEGGVYAWEVPKFGINAWVRLLPWPE